MSNLYLFPAYLQIEKRERKKRRKGNKIHYVILKTTKTREMFYFDPSSPCFSQKLILMPAFLKLANSTKEKQKVCGFCL